MAPDRQLDNVWRCNCIHAELDLRQKKGCTVSAVWGDTSNSSSNLTQVPFVHCSVPSMSPCVLAKRWSQPEHLCVEHGPCENVRETSNSSLERQQYLAPIDLVHTTPAHYHYAISPWPPLFLRWTILCWGFTYSQPLFCAGPIADQSVKGFTWLSQYVIPSQNLIPVWNANDDLAMNILQEHESTYKILHSFGQK